MSTLQELQAHGKSDARTEAMADLREFVRQAEAAGELQRVNGASVDKEIGVLFDLSNMYEYPPVLLFENIPGFDARFRILSNVRTSKIIIGDISLDAVKAYRQRPKEKSEAIPPVFVDDGPIFENIVEGTAVDLSRYPAPKWHPNDGGRYIGTECLVIMQDPEIDWVNAGTYRVVVHDDKTLGIFIDTGKHGDHIRKKWWAQGKACPCVVTVGQAPILGILGSTAANFGESEFAIAGGRVRRALRMVRGKGTGIPIPADAEMAFEGYMPPPEEEMRPEGPFGEWPGYYASDARPEPVIRVTAVYHRDNPMILGQAPLTPIHLGQQPKINRIAATWDALEAVGVGGITGVWKLPGGGSRYIDVISIKQQFAGHAKMAGLVAAGARTSGYQTRLIIIVDDDIDVTNPTEVMWAIATRWDPKTQTDIIDGCWTGHIDPSLSPEKRASGDITTSRMIIYAVRPYHWKDEFPIANTLSKEYTADVRAKWASVLPFVAGLQR